MPRCSLDELTARPRKSGLVWIRGARACILYALKGLRSTLNLLSAKQLPCFVLQADVRLTLRLQACVDPQLEQDGLNTYYLPLAVPRLRLHLRLATMLGHVSPMVLSLVLHSLVLYLDIL